jgi:S-(hydroxymethyl)glutathione dehydrogenase/alcohol dehydrogenase
MVEQSSLEEPSRRPREKYKECETRETLAAIARDPDHSSRSQMKAAVLYERKTPLKVEQVDLDAPHAGEVRVKVVANGVCHSDYSVIHGVVPLPVPIVLGHEGAGIVEEIGTGVTLVKPGDHVLLSAIPYCGNCYYCSLGEFVQCDNMAAVMARGTMADGTSRLRKNGTPLHHMVGLSTMAEYAVVAERACVKLPPEVSLATACLVGCGVMTGVGAAINTARVAAGSSAVVIGCGGVGMNVIQGCALAGANTIIAVDLLDYKLEAARQFGATHTINPQREDALKVIRSLTEGRGADYAFEVIGTGKTIEMAYAAVRRRGTAIVVGAAAREDRVTLPAASFLAEKTLKGSAYGSSRPRVDLPRLIGLYTQGKLKLDELVTKTFTLDEVNDAMTALEKGEVVRSVLLM